MDTTTKQASYKLKTVAIEIVCEGNAVVGGSINGSHQAALIARGMIGNATKEHFVALHLDNQNRIVSTETISIGTMNASLVHPRETFRAALIAGAASIIVAHNHPSGDTTPSDEDRRVTERLAAAARILGVNLLDHLIVTNSTAYYSFADAGALVRGSDYRGTHPDLATALGEAPAPYGQRCQRDGCRAQASRTTTTGWAACDDHASIVEGHTTLMAIVDAMSGQEWGADTLDEIASILRGAGYEIADSDDSLQDHDTIDAADPTDQPEWVFERGARYLTARTVRVGRVVALADPVRFACRFFCKELGGIVGAGGRLLPRDLIDQPAVVWSCGTPRSRVLIAWDSGNLGAWVDVDMLRVIEQEPSTVQETPLRYRIADAIAEAELDAAARNAILPCGAGPLDRWTCSTCGSAEVEISAWLDANTGEEQPDERPVGYYFCRNCDDFAESICLMQRAADGTGWTCEAICNCVHAQPEHAEECREPRAPYGGTDDKPAAGKVYSLLALSKTQSWTASEVTPETASTPAPRFQPAYCNPTNETRGEKYEPSLDVKEIAKRIRADIAKAIEAGELPAGVKVSVRIERYSMGQSLDVRVTALPAGFAILNPARVWAEKAKLDVSDWPRENLTEQAAAIVATLKAIHDAYNRDNSDIQSDYFDVNYHGDVSIDWALLDADTEPALLRWIESDARD